MQASGGDQLRKTGGKKSPGREESEIAGEIVLGGGEVVNG